MFSLYILFGSPYFFLSPFYSFHFFVVVGVYWYSISTVSLLLSFYSFCSLLTFQYTFGIGECECVHKNVCYIVYYNKQNRRVMFRGFLFLLSWTCISRRSMYAVRCSAQPFNPIALISHLCVLYRCQCNRNKQQIYKYSDWIYLLLFSHMKWCECGK